MGEVNIVAQPFKVVSNIVQSMGYSTCNCIGCAKEISNHCVGILLNDSSESISLRFLKHKSRRTFVGVIWFENSVRKATLDNWIFEVHGEEHINLAQDIAHKIIKEIDVNIQIKLSTEQNRKER